MKKKVFTAIGLMSGTSLDGVDLSLIKSDGYNEFTCILDDYYRFDDKLQKSIVNLRTKISNNKDLIHHANELKFKEITLFHSKVISEV